MLDGGSAPITAVSNTMTSSPAVSAAFKSFLDLKLRSVYMLLLFPFFRGIFSVADVSYICQAGFTNLLDEVAIRVERTFVLHLWA